MHLLAIILLSVVPIEFVIRDYVDVIELNRFFDHDGKPVFDQIIFIGVVNGQEQIRAWRMLKSPSQIPVRDWQHGGYVALWMDGDELRQIRTASLRETWTQYDPEILARETLKPEHRHPLRQFGGWVGR